MLILKQNAANTVPTPPAGKGTIFLNDQDDLAVKTADGNVATFPTAGGSNTQVYFNDNGSFGANSNFVYDKTTSVLTVTGNVAATRVLTDNLLYANGTAWDLSDPGGSNTQIQFNDSESFGGSAAFTFDKSSNLVTVSANLNANNLNATTHITSGNVWANSGIIGAQTLKGEGGNISNIQGGNVSGTVSSATTAGTVTTAAQPNITSVGTLTSAAVTGNVTAGNVYANSGTIGASLLTGTLTTTAQPNITSVGTLTSAAVTGNVTAGNVYANSGTIGAQTLKGEGGNISNIQGANVSGAVSSATTAGTVTTAAQPNITSVGTLTSLSVTGNISAGNVSATTFTGDLSGAATTAGTVTTAAQPNITSVGTLSSLSVTANVAAGNLTTTGVLSVTGTGVSSIAGNLDMTSNTIINLATPTNATDAATKQYVDDIAQGLHTHDSCNAATDGTLATISGGTVTYNNGTSGVGATLTTTGSYTTIDGVTLSNGMRILVKNEANAAHNGIYDRTSSTVLTRSTDFDTPAEMAGGDFTFVTAGTLYDNTGWVMTDAVTTVGTDPVNWVQFSGAGTYTAGTGLTLTGSQFSISNTTVSAATYGNGDRVASFTVNAQGQLTAASNVVIAANAANLTGTTLASGITTSSLTTVGTLGSLAVTGNTTAGNVYANSGTIGASLLTGTLTTAAQPNVTSVGTLSSLTVSGNGGFGNVNTSGTETASRFISNVATGTAPLTVTSTTRVGNLNVAYANVSDYVGTGSALNGNFNIALISGTSGNVQPLGNTAFIANASTGTLYATTFVGALTGAATTAGTVTTAAQPNITSVGTLTGLTLANASVISVGSNTNVGTFTGNFSLSAGSRLNATYADIAEKYSADATYESGTVLIFGGEQEVTLSNAFDSTKVAGVVTTNPAYSMNSALEADHVAEIALQGRVPCKVIGPVEKGDLMVSASNGHAIANNEARAGTIIGKALENFNGESGIIEVAVGRF